MIRPLLILTLLAATALGATPSLTILPSSITLDGPESTHRVIVLPIQDGEYRKQVTDTVTLKSDNPDVATVTNGIVRPHANGTTTITAVDTHGVKASTTITVKNMTTDHEWSFVNHVLPVMAKAGCNSGACHGALAGKGGFKLSLRGYAPTMDFHTITKQARGRRIEPDDPGRSLVLAKPTGAIKHKGGTLIEEKSREYRVLADWIATGAKGPSPSDATLQKLEILPDRSMLQPGDTQQIVVQAHYSDGRVEDVTNWAKYTSANEAVAKIDESGQASVIGYGEGAVTAWYSSKIVIARITSPYASEVAPSVYESVPQRNFIDELVTKQLKRLNLPPSPPADDATFLRRIYLDTIGTLPTIEETESFLKDDDEDKRNKLIDTLLARDEFVDYWTYKWSDVLLLSGNRLRPEPLKAYYQWIHGHVKANTPWDRFVRAIVTSQGSSVENGATNFFALHQDPENMSENVSQAFLGLSIACAKCHNHPLEKWTNDQYYGMANLFSRVRAKGWGGDFRSGDGKRTLHVVPDGELLQPLTGKPQPPTPLDGDPIPFEATNDRRIHLAYWLTSPDNPYFARSITNRVWANFFGVGLVEEVDDMRLTNPASNEELLATASDYLIEQKFNLKSLMRMILQSATYQRSSQPLPANADEGRFYSRYYPRRLMAEVLLDAVSDVTKVPSEFNEIAFPGGDRKKTDFYPKGTKALQLYDAAVSSYFLKTFGRNPRDITCECERSDEPSMIQVLHISNGDTINSKLQAKEGRVAQLLNEDLTPEQLVERVYLACLSRYPTDRERSQLAPFIKEASDKDKRVVVEDLFWSLLSSREFMFNH